MLSCFSPVLLFETPWNVAHQAPLSMGFSRQEYCSGLPFPSPGDLPDPGIKPKFPALQADPLVSEPPGKPQMIYTPSPNMPGRTEPWRDTKDHWLDGLFPRHTYSSLLAGRALDLSEHVQEGSQSLVPTPSSLCHLGDLNPVASAGHLGWLTQDKKGHTHLAGLLG